MGMCVFWKGGEGKLKIKAELQWVRMGFALLPGRKEEEETAAPAAGPCRDRGSSGQAAHDRSLSVSPQKILFSIF